MISCFFAQKDLINSALAIAVFVCASVLGSPAQKEDHADGSGIAIAISGISHSSRYWKYEVHLKTGTVRLVEENQAKPTAYPFPAANDIAAGAIDGCDEKTRLSSKDNRYVVECMPPAKSDLSRGHYSVGIRETKNSVLTLSWTPTEWRRIDGIAWSPDSGSVAILNHAEYYGKTPGELFIAISGHPIPHDTVYLTVIDTRTGKKGEYLIRRNVKYATSRILRWSE